MIYRKINSFTSIECNESIEGEIIEHKVERIMNNNEPIEDVAPLIYTDRRDGVMPQYDIRTDRFDVALDAMDVVSATNLAKRQEYLKSLDSKDGEGDSGSLEQSSDNTSDS